jgi:hypothetical protein
VILPCGTWSSLKVEVASVDGAIRTEIEAGWGGDPAAIDGRETESVTPTSLICRFLLRHPGGRAARPRQSSIA